MDLKSILQVLEDDEFDLDSPSSSRVVFFNDLKNAYKSTPNITGKFYDLKVARILLNPDYRKISQVESKEEIKGIYKEVLELGLEKVYALENELTFTISRMESLGIRLDIKKLFELDNLASKTIQSTQERIFKLIGKKINLNSPKQLSQLLFEELNLPTHNVKRGKQGFSTDFETLLYLSHFSEIPELILQNRLYAKAKSSFIIPLLKKNIDGIVYPLINQIGTATGRITYENPNIQALPVKYEFSSRIRDCVIAGKDRLFIRADYSQIELRILAHFSEDKYLVEAFKANKDIHSETAKVIFNLDKNSKVEQWQRAVGKTVNFSILYGITHYGLARALSITEEHASKILKEFFSKLSKVDQYFKNLIRQANKDSRVKSILGRLRWINMFKGSERVRVIKNSPIQASASDIIKIAMNDITRTIKRQSLDASIQIQVHDELVVNTNKSCANEVKEILKECMENALKLSVPLKVEISEGETWFETIEGKNN